jgi:glyoxylase-like metal-dependent hydrolase (beta-lactamase superfamily II)
MADQLKVRTLVSAPFQENSYVVWGADQRDAVVIDPGFEPELILDCLKEEGLAAAAILNTHGHADHIGGNCEMKRRFPDAPLMIGFHEADLLSNPAANLSAPFGMPVVSPIADRLLKEGDSVEAAGLRFEVLELPGHSPGHVVFLCRQDPPIVFGGDVLFREGVGRYDFPGSDGQLLFQGIRSKLFTLPKQTVIYPGHGPVTTIGHELQFNPFVGKNAGPVF